MSARRRPCFFHLRHRLGEFLGVSGIIGWVEGLDNGDEGEPVVGVFVGCLQFLVEDAEGVFAALEVFVGGDERAEDGGGMRKFLIGEFESFEGGFVVGGILAKEGRVADLSG